jgi:lysylphosphatidylglycerol synthetase-like protein (DUF2156 family)
LRDPLLASDPGWQRFRSAFDSAVSLAAVLAVEWVFAHFTHALQLPLTKGLTVSEAAQVSLERHGVVAIAMVLGAVLYLMFHRRDRRHG